MIYVPRGLMRQITEPLPRLPSSDFEEFQTASAQNVLPGNGIKVAILDTGIDPNHTALQPSIEKTKDFTGSLRGVFDESAHGTLVAGVVAAHRQAAGSAGVAPGARLFIGKVLRNHNGGGDVEHLLKGIRWAIDQQVQIINISLGSQEELPEVKNAFQEAGRKNVFVICAAGNRGSQGLDYPAQYDNCVAVGAIDGDGRRWEDGQDASAIGTELDIAAFGDSVMSTWPGGGYGRKSGTSLAAPFVSGVLALVLAMQRDQRVRRPIRTLPQLLTRLKQTAIDRVNDDEYVRLEIDRERFLNSLEPVSDN